MKRLITLISSEGKSPQQLAKETWAAYQKYLKAEKKAKKSLVAKTSPGNKTI